MAQINFKDDEFHGTLHFVVTAMEYDEPFQKVGLKVDNFESFVSYMAKFYGGDYDDLFKGLTIESLEFTGISFTGRQGTERFSVDITNGWKRATTMFDEKKFADVNKDKMERIQKILNEK